MKPSTVVAAAAAVVVYVAMWAGHLQGWAWLGAVDDWFLAAFYEIGQVHPAWVTWWDWFCSVFSPASFRIVSLVLILWLLSSRRLAPALFLLVSVELSGVVTALAKSLADRPRPATGMAYATSSSFPSGHALGVMACVLALLTVVVPLVAVRWRTPLMVLGAMIIVAVGVGRVVLNVHHPSDVVAGWALGYLYYLLCLPLLTVRAEKPAVRDTSR